MLELILANKNYSSWSMRAWLYMRESNLQFKESVFELFTDQWNGNIRNYNPIGKAPALVVNETIKIWDSLAIIAYLQQTRADTLKWPSDPEILAKAWSVTAEMHSGFLGIRNQLPMNLKQKTNTPSIDDATRTQIARIDEIWAECVQQYGGPWLFGDFSIADIMYIPVALRFITYDIPVSKEAQRFITAAIKRESVKEWVNGAKMETAKLDFIDQLLPVEQTPLTPG